MKIEGISRFSFPTNVVFGPGAIKELPGIFSELGVKKPFIVTDPGFSKTDSFKSIVDVLEGSGVSYYVYTDVNPNPHDSDVEKGRMNTERTDVTVSLQSEAEAPWTPPRQ